LSSPTWVNMAGQLVQTTTSDGLYLHGYYQPTDDKQVAVLHIHGFEGNFYENSFVHVLVEELETANIGFLTVNTRGNGKNTDFNTTDGTLRRIGSHYELLEEAHLDITAWMQFLVDEGYQQIILDGHSAGALKVARYMIEGELKEKVDKLMLLSPVDTKGVMIARGRTDVDGLVRRAEQMVTDGKGDEFITQEFEDDPMTYRNYVSWYTQNDMGKIFDLCVPNYDFPILRQITVPTKVITGSNDEFFCRSNPDKFEETMAILLKQLAHAEGVIIPAATHCYLGHELPLAHEIISFIHKNHQSD